MHILNNLQNLRMCAAVNYAPGDIVWVKVPRYPWWPAEVVAQEDCKVINHGKKEPIAFITFPCEDAYDIIRSQSNIRPFNAEQKKNYIKKGEKLPNDLNDRFQSALKYAHKTVKSHPESDTRDAPTTNTHSDSLSNLSQNDKSSAECNSQSRTDFCPDSVSSTAEPTENCTVSNYTNETSDHLRYSCSQCDFSTCRLNLMLIHYKPDENVLRCPSLPESVVTHAESRKRKMVENDAYLRNQHFKSPRRVSTSESIVGRVPCYARKPASPPSQKAVSPTTHDKGSCYMFHDEPVKQPAHKPSFSYRSVQKKKDSPCMGDTDSPKRSSSVPPQPKTHAKQKTSKDQRNGVLSPSMAEKRKEYQTGTAEEESQSPTRLTPEMSTREAQSINEKKSNGEKDVEREQVDDDNSKSKKTDSSERQKDAESNMDGKSVSSEESSFSSDDEITDGASAIQSDLPVVENDAVWVKFDKYPFWPALISKVYTKRHHIYRLGIRFFGEILSTESLEFGIRYTKETVIQFNDTCKEEFIKIGEESEYKEKFLLALNKVNDYLKKDNSELSGDSTEHEQYIYKSSCSSPFPCQFEKVIEENNVVTESTWYPVENVNIVEEAQTVEMVSSDLVEHPEDVCQTVLELDNSESSKELSTVSVMPEIWIPSVEETIGSEVVLHDIDSEVLIPTDID